MVFLNMGFDVVAMGASIKVCKEAEGYLNRPVLCRIFEKMEIVGSSMRSGSMHRCCM